MPVSSLPGLTALRVRPPSGHGTRAVLRRRTRLRGSGCQPLSSCPFCGDLGPRTDRRDVASAASVKGLKSRGRGAKRFRVRHGPERVHRRIAREFRRRARPFGKKNSSHRSRAFEVRLSQGPSWLCCDEALKLERAVAALVRRRIRRRRLRRMINRQPRSLFDLLEGAV
jgi:hypothetical protein